MMVSMIVNRDSARLEDEDLLVAFANTGHAGPDQLDDVAGLRTWADSVGLSAGLPPIDPAEDLELLRQIRDSVRGLLLTNNGVAVAVDFKPLESIPLRL